MFDHSDIDLLKNKAWILHKNEVLVQVEKQLYQAANNLQATNVYQAFKSKFPELKNIPKVNRGENLRGLPYRLLDFPVYFDKDNVLAFRLLFWWGNQIHFILHLKGKYLNAVGKSQLKILLEQDSNLKYRNAGEEWSFDYKSYETNTDLISSAPFLQICKQYPIEDLNKVDEILKNDFSELSSLFNDIGD